MGKLLRRLRYWLHHRRADAELAEEIELHRAMRQGQLERSGLSTAEAATASRRLIGNAGRAREETRDVWGWTWFGDAWRDLSYGARALRKSPGFLLTAVLMLSLGIGVNLAAFQVLDGVFWRPPQVRDPASLVRFSHGSARGFDSDNLPYPAIAFLESNHSVLAAVLVRSDSWTTTFNDIHRLTWGDDPANRPRASFVSANWFDELDYRPLQGRVFHQGVDDAPDAQPAVVISLEFWERHLNRDPNIVGQTVRINSRPALVRGIVPRDLMPRHDTMIWMPITQIDYFVPGTAFKTSWDPSVTGVHLFGRLRPGISTAAAREALRGVMGDLAIQQPKSFAKGDLLEPVSGSLNFLPPRRRLEAWLFTIVGFGLTLLILIISCANLINLILSRAVERVRELSICVALGASRWRVMRRLSGESIWLVLVSSLGGFLLVYWASRIFVALVELPGLPDLNPNWRTILATLVAGAVTIAAVGLIPAWKVGRSDLITAMKDGGQQASSGLRRTRLRHVLLTAQLGGSCLLLVLTGLILHSLQRVMMDRGFDFENVAVLTAPLERLGIKDAEALSYWNRLRDVVASHPETEAVALVSHPPLEGRSLAPNLGLPLEVTYFEVGPEFFNVMRIPILAGRTFGNSDEFGGSAVISRRLAMEMYGTLDVIGKGFPQNRPRETIVGIVGDARLAQSEDPNGAAFYAPLNPKRSSRTLIARAKANPEHLLPLMRESARSYDDKILPDAHLLAKDSAARGGGDARAMSVLLAILGSLALSITSVGVFGTVSYAATLRRKELGIRIALGAGRGSIILALLKQLIWPLAVGLAGGVAAAMLLGGAAMFADRPLYVRPFDPSILASAVAFLLITAGIAAVLPAWRALRLDVLQSIRAE